MVLRCSHVVHKAGTGQRLQRAGPRVQVRLSVATVTGAAAPLPSSEAAAAATTPVQRFSAAVAVPAGLPYKRVRDGAAVPLLPGATAAAAVRPLISGAVVRAAGLPFSAAAVTRTGAGQQLLQAAAGRAVPLSPGAAAAAAVRLYPGAAAGKAVRPYPGAAVAEAGEVLFSAVLPLEAGVQPALQEEAVGAAADLPGDKEIPVFIA